MLEGLTGAVITGHVFIHLFENIKLIKDILRQYKWRDTINAA